jgi:predicted nucleotidyltransferase
MTQSLKCQAKGGPANCHNPRCPERALQSMAVLPSSFVELGKLAQPKPVAMTWSNKDTVLFKTLHGSRLYGLHHEESDDDYYAITPTAYTKRHLNAKHKIDGVNDTVTVDFRTFVAMVHEGAPQALEAMFSKKAESPYFEDYRKNWFASDPRVVAKYIQTIHRFSMEEKESPKALKYHRHALRLSLNLEELVYTGRFDPTLNESNVRLVKALAEKPHKEFLKELNAVNPFDLNWTYDE